LVSSEILARTLAERESPGLSFGLSSLLANAGSRRSAGSVQVNRIGCGLSHFKNASGKYAEVQRAHSGYCKSESQGRRDFRRRIIFRRLPEIHRDNHAQIIISADHAVDRCNHNEPDDLRTERRLGIERSLKRKKLSEKSSSGRQSQQRKQEQRETNGEH